MYRNNRQTFVNDGKWVASFILTFTTGQYFVLDFNKSNLIVTFYLGGFTKVQIRGS